MSGSETERTKIQCAPSAPNHSEQLPIRHAQNVSVSLLEYQEMIHTLPRHARCRHLKHIAKNGCLRRLSEEEKRNLKKDNNLLELNTFVRMHVFRCAY